MIKYILEKFQTYSDITTDSFCNMFQKLAGLKNIFRKKSKVYLYFNSKKSWGSIRLCFKFVLLTEGKTNAQRSVLLKSWNIMKSSKRPSKYHLSTNVLAQKKTAFPILKKFKTRTF